MNCRFAQKNAVVLTTFGGDDTQILLDVLKKLNFVLHRRWECKKFPISPRSRALVLALEPYTSHLVKLLKLSLPNVCIVRYVNCAIDKVKDCPPGQLPPNMMEEMEKIKEQMKC